ncbi:trypsin-like peptidase domain-containing protein [Streptomyces sp. NPDC059373]
MTLNDLVKAATVSIGPAEGDSLQGPMWGSGFFVAPGWVLTCAHVLRWRGGWRGDRELLVSNGELTARARAAYCLPHPDEHDAVAGEPDLALLRLLDPVPEHECVWLSDRTDPPLGEADVKVMAHGWYPGEAKGGSGKPLRWSGVCEINGNEGDYGLGLGPQREIPHGASGGPVVDLVRGAVVGVVRKQRANRDGGLSVATTALRELSSAASLDGEEWLGPDPYQGLIHAHDTWHHRDSSRNAWGTVQAGLPGNRLADNPLLWAPADRITAFGLLAALPPPRSPSEVVRALDSARGEVQPRPAVAPRAWRDGHGLLYERQHPVEAFAFLLYLCNAAAASGPHSPHATRSVELWVRKRAKGLPTDMRQFLWALVPRTAPVPVPAPASESAPGPEPAPVVAQRRPVVGVALGIAVRDEEPPYTGPAVVLELEQVWWQTSGHVYWHIWVLRDGDDPELITARTTGEGVAIEDLPGDLRRPLSRLFFLLDQGSGRPCPLHIALPVDHFDTPVHLWQLADVVRTFRRGDLSHQPLGVQRPVTVRRAPVRGAPVSASVPGPRPERWPAVDPGNLRALAVPPPGHRLSYREIEGAPPAAVPVLCRPVSRGPGREALNLLLEAGHRVALWRIEPHPPGDCGPGCDDFRRGTTELLNRATTLNALPEFVRSLRELVYRSDGQDGESSHWVDGLALMFDDPGRAIPVLPGGTLDSP